MKEQSVLIAQVMVMSLMSQPVADEVGVCFLYLLDNLLGSFSVLF